MINVHYFKGDEEQNSCNPTSSESEAESCDESVHVSFHYAWCLHIENTR